MKKPLFFLLASLVQVHPAYSQDVGEGPDVTALKHIRALLPPGAVVLDDRIAPVFPGDGKQTHHDAAKASSLAKAISAEVGSLESARSCDAQGRNCRLTVVGVLAVGDAIKTSDGIQVAVIAWIPNQQPSRSAYHWEQFEINVNRTDKGWAVTGARRTSQS